MAVTYTVTDSSSSKVIVFSGVICFLLELPSVRLLFTGIISQVPFLILSFCFSIVMLNLLILPLENSGSWMSKVADSSHYYTKTTNMTASINAKKKPKCQCVYETKLFMLFITLNSVFNRARQINLWGQYIG